MDPFIQQWIKAKRKAVEAEDAQYVAMDNARMYAKGPDRVRPAMPSDIVVNAVIWHRSPVWDWDKEALRDRGEVIIWETGEYYPWEFYIVGEVLDATHKHKAYTDLDRGTQHGLWNAWVEDNPYAVRKMIS